MRHAKSVKIILKETREEITTDFITLYQTYTICCNRPNLKWHSQQLRISPSLSRMCSKQLFTSCFTSFFFHKLCFISLSLGWAPTICSKSRFAQAICSKFYILSPFSVFCSIPQQKFALEVSRLDGPTIHLTFRSESNSRRF